MTEQRQHRQNHDREEHKDRPVALLRLFDQIETDVRKRGLTRREAIVFSTMRRARPVALTALAAILAMIPLSRSAFWGPMAFIIMGGLSVATFLTLFLLPSICALRRRRWDTRARGRSLNARRTSTRSALRRLRSRRRRAPKVRLAGSLTQLCDFHIWKTHRGRPARSCTPCVNSSRLGVTRPPLEWRRWKSTTSWTL